MTSFSLSLDIIVLNLAAGRCCRMLPSKLEFYHFFESRWCRDATVTPRLSLYMVMQQGMERVLKSVHGQVGELPQNRYLMNINFMGTYHCVQAALATMRRQQSGHFVLLSS